MGSMHSCTLIMHTCKSEKITPSLLNLIGLFFTVVDEFGILIVLSVYDRCVVEVRFKSERRN